LPRGRAWRGWLWILLATGLLAFLVRTTWAGEASPQAAIGSPAPASFPWIALIAAFGVGTVAAAIVGWLSARAVAISNHRQNWINAPREDIVTFLKELDLLHFRLAKMNQSGYTDDLEKQQELRAALLLVRRRIRLRLNMTETPSKSLDAALEACNTIDTRVAKQERVDAVLNASAVVLKREWEVTKYGNLAGLVTGDRLQFFRRWLNAFGLCLGIVGVIFIFIWGPPQPTFQRGVFLAIEDRNVLPDGRTVAQHDAEKAANEEHYKRMSQIGLALILAGFLLQFGNEFLPRNRSAE
jgi:hypothetical protein